VRNRVDPRTRLARAIAGGIVSPLFLETIIPDSVRVPESAVQQVPVVYADPRCSVSRALRRVGLEIEARLRRASGASIEIDDLEAELVEPA
jgi:cellulose biosynthesis protein BcsQ